MLKNKLIALLTFFIFFFTNIGATIPIFADEISSQVYCYDGYEVKYDIINSWDTTQIISITISNNSDNDIENWMLYFEPNGQIESIWDASIELSNNSIAYIKNNGYNANISPHSSTTFSYSITNCENIPQDFILCQHRISKSDGYNIELKVNEVWENNYFNGEIIIENNTDKPIEAWELEFDTNFTIIEITNSWSAIVTELEEYKYHLKGTYNSIVYPNSTTCLGFTGIKNGEPQINNVQLTEIVANDELIYKLKFENSNNENDNYNDEQIEIFSYGRIEKDNICIEWIPNNKIDNVIYSIYESNDNINYNYIDSSTKYNYTYALNDAFDIKYFYVEAMLNDNIIGKSPSFYVINENGSYSIKYIDTDSDGISDYIENMIGTDINNIDTDKDNLTDYYEYFILQTNPTEPDTNDNGITDDLEDFDSDGLNNIEEYINNTKPFNNDTDDDKLLDGEEIYTYFTNPSFPDSDNDTISDYDEINLGLNPNDINDNNTLVHQIIEKDNKCLSKVNVEGVPYNLSMEIIASGCVESNLNVENNSNYNALYSFDTIGLMPELEYNAGEIQKVTLKYTFNEEFLTENSNIPIDSYNIFKLDERTNMFVPIKTYMGYENNTIYCESDSLGTYCVKNIDDWLLNFNNLSESENEEQVTTFNLRQENEDTNEPFYVFFALDNCTVPMMAMSDFTYAKESILNVSEQLFNQYNNVNVVILPYNASLCEGYLFESLYNIEEFLSQIPLQSINNWSLVEQPMYYTSLCIDKSYEKFLFIFNQGLISNITESDYDLVIGELSQEDDIHVSFVTPSIMNIGVENYVKNYADEYNGKMFSLTSKNVADEIYDYIYDDVTGKNITLPDIPNTDDNEDDDPKEKLTSDYILSLRLKHETLKEPITKNSSVNSDDDALTDYEELIPNCELINWDEDNNIILPSLRDIINYNHEAIDIEELLSEQETNLDIDKIKILPVRCNPCCSDTDKDFFDDFEEISNNSSPTKFNILISTTDIDTLTDNNRYIATSCRDYYDESTWAQISVFLANNVYGTTHDYIKLHKDTILTYFSETSKIVSNNSSASSETSLILYYTNVLTQIETIISKGYLIYSTDIEKSALKTLSSDLYEECCNILTSYKYGYISSQQLIEQENNLIHELANSSIIKQYNANKYIGAVVDVLDNANTFVTIVSIAAGGAVTLTDSIDSIFNIIQYREYISTHIDILNYIIKNNENYSLSTAAIQLKSDIENKTDMFMIESLYLLGDCGLSIGDATLKYKLSECSAIGATIVASLAVFEAIFDLNEIGINTLQCYNLATISDSLIQKINIQFSNLDVNVISTGYYGELIGDYIIYDNTSDYLYSIHLLGVSRIMGEETISNTPFQTQDIIDLCKTNQYLVNNIMRKY